MMKPSTIQRTVWFGGCTAMKKITPLPISASTQTSRKIPAGIAQGPGVGHLAVP